MFRTVSVTAACALALIFCAPGHAQDSSPSLGDIARQAQKDKANKPAAKVFTNDDLHSTSSSASSTSSGGPGRVATQQSGLGSSADNPDAIQSPQEVLAKLQAGLDRLDSLDRASLAADVLGGNTSNFPGRANWEGKLFSAKQLFVAQTRGVLQKVAQLAASSESIKDVQDPNDPRAKALQAKLQALVQETQQDSAVFQAVAQEGKDLAGQSSGH